MRIFAAGNRRRAFVIILLVAVVIIGLKFASATGSPRVLAKKAEVLQAIIADAQLFSDFPSPRSHPKLKLPPLTVKVAGGENSWRMLWASLPRENVNLSSTDTLWTSPRYDYLDDSFCGLFCLSQLDVCRSLSREKRFTRLMAIADDEGAFSLIRKLGWREVLQTASDCILIVEVANSRQPWMEGGDLSIASLPPLIGPPNELGIGSDSEDGAFLVGFVDGEVWTLDQTVPFSDVRKFLTVKGASSVDRDAVLGAYCRAKSPAVLTSISDKTQ